MKSLKRLGVAGLTAWAAWTAGGLAQAKPLKAVVELAGKKDPEVYYVTRVDAKNVILSPKPEGVPELTYGLATVKSLKFDDPEGWAPVIAACRRGDSAAVAQALATFSSDYGGLVAAKDSAGALAVFYTMESLRLTGQWDKLAAEYDRVRGLGVSLSDSYQPQMKLYPLWIAAGRKQWAQVSTGVKEYEQSLTPGQPKPTNPPFKPMAPTQAAQVAYMRAVWIESTGDKAAALNDFYRAATLNQGTERELTRLALGNALRLIKAEPALAGGSEKKPSREGYALALIYKNQFGDLPADYAAFLTQAPPDEAASAPEKKDDAAPAAEAKKEEPKKPEAKKPEAKKGK